MRRSRRPSEAPPPALRTSVAATASLILLLALLPVPPPASAHGTPVALDFWGDFPLATARCQRIIGRAAAVCGLRVWRARRDCALAPLRGGACDPATTDARVEAARIAAIDDVSAACSPQQLAALQFLDVREAQADVIRFCRELDAATASLVLEPLAIAPAAAAACGEPAAWVTTRLLAGAFRSRQRALDRIAATSISAGDKRARVAASTAAIGRATMQLADALASSCPADLFAATFLRDAVDLLAAVAARADCLAGDAYSQGGLICPPARCGNRIREGGEECDDGNVRDGDGCRADCRRETTTSGSPN